MPKEKREIKVEVSYTPGWEEKYARLVYDLYKKKEKELLEKEAKETA